MPLQRDILFLPLHLYKVSESVIFPGGFDFEFFRPVFNIADVWVSTGVAGLLIFQKRFFKQKEAGRRSEKAVLNEPA